MLLKSNFVKNSLQPKRRASDEKFYSKWKVSLKYSLGFKLKKKSREYFKMTRLGQVDQYETTTWSI